MHCKRQGRLKSSASTPAARECVSSNLPSVSILGHLLYLRRAKIQRKKAHLEMSGLSEEVEADSIKRLSDTSTQTDV
ncbi:hypothetical protein BGY98DRAFT_976797, partial [Russula aff. rugulosa BPL654]